jgi:hypothetical protein
MDLVGERREATVEIVLTLPTHALYVSFAKKNCLIVLPRNSMTVLIAKMIRVLVVDTLQVACIWPPA